MFSKSLRTTALAAAIISAVTFAPLGHAGDAQPLIAAVSGQNGGTPSLAPMLKNVIPAVVNISVKGQKNVGPAIDIPEQFRFMFPDLNTNRQREFRALGSGVIIDAKKGYVVTNHHVVADADVIRVALSDGREFEAKKIGSDEHTDVALLELKDFSDLTQLAVADSDGLQVGDFAIAIGNPFGLGQTVTSGIISALGRTGLNIENIENFIQTDAAINSGNSGGALVNLHGQLVGINTAILGPNGGNIGIGFAIPSNMVKTVINQLSEYGEVRRGQLGVTGSELNADLAKSFGYEHNSGAFINEVMEDSAADKAGIKSGDIITSVDGKRISSFGELRAKVATIGAGNEVTLGIFRDGKNLTIKVTLEESSAVDSADVSEISPSFKGAKLSNDKDGVAVTEVAPRTPAYSIGLREGDIITGVNKNRVRTLADLKKYLDDSKGKVNALRIKRGNSSVFITIR